MAILRAGFAAEGVLTCAQTSAEKNGARVKTSGIVLVRQRPGKGNVTFITLEDETGIANVIAWQRIFEAHRRIILASSMIGVRGTLQREGKVTHIVTDSLEDLTPLLDQVGAMDFPHRTGPGDGARSGGYDPREAAHRRHRLVQPGESAIRVKSRDFH